MGHVGQGLGLGLHGPPQFAVDGLLLLDRGAQAVGRLHAGVVVARRQRREQYPQETIAVRFPCDTHDTHETHTPHTRHTSSQ